jgi:ATP-binding cassette subfamily E protein 1
MYGKPAVFGVVSLIKAEKTGINTYLHGFLKEDNVRFRDYPIKFEPKPPEKFHKAEILTTWEKIDEKLGSFELKAEPGTIQRHDIIGILGENGIGKTSFVKILGGVIKSKSSLADLKISYKPQYLETNEELVSIFLKGSSEYEQIFRPLELKGLFEKKLSELSGGELQRVSIARCLTQEADLYLLDEPSAYLDVEQRLMISKIIREMMEFRKKAALIVDHDLLFIDYLSKKLIVFKGKPAIHGEVKGPFSMEEGMNLFLKDLNLSFRRDEENHRPRANKVDSQMDRKQKSEGKLYYI